MFPNIAHSTITGSFLDIAHRTSNEKLEEEQEQLVNYSLKHHIFKINPVFSHLHNAQLVVVAVD